MNLTWVLLNSAYVFYAVSGMFKEILKLRVVLAMATVLFIGYGALSGIWSVFWWNLPVLAIHVWHIVTILIERNRVNLDDKARAVHTLLLPDLDLVAFSAWWNTGKNRTVNDATLTQQGVEVTELYLLIDGTVDIYVSGRQVVALGTLRLIGEASTLTGSPASATVTTHGRADLRVWNKAELGELFAKRPEVESAFLRMAGQDLADKLSRADRT